MSRVQLEELKRERNKVSVDESGDVYVFDDYHNLLMIFSSRNTVEEIERMLMTMGFGYETNGTK